MPTSEESVVVSELIRQRRWDCFVKNLMGAEPPKEYTLGGGR